MTWYHEQRPGLGHELQQEFFDHLIKLQTQPAQYPLVFDRFRRILLKRFPYKIVYSIWLKAENSVCRSALAHQTESWKFGEIAKKISM